MKENLNRSGKYSIGVFGKKLIGVDRDSFARAIILCLAEYISFSSLPSIILKP